jgi:hypothetical protein
VLPGRDADHSPTSSADVKKKRGYTSSHPVRLSWRVVDHLYFILPPQILTLRDANSRDKFYLRSTSNFITARKNLNVNRHYSHVVSLGLYSS